MKPNPKINKKSCLYRQIGDVTKKYPEYIFLPDETDDYHYLGGGAFG